MNKEIIIPLGLVILVLVSIVGFLYAVDRNTPVTWKACGTGWSAACFKVESRDQIKETENGCITDGDTVICGSHWIKQGKW